ncbi:uncharacterized protein LOC106755405 [Vigna radiata var. radiata]|uniref:Uncharacterized protein LOC106755405 n=1 Tax=Vigna radiata var. radiata TaxID=3916 RepID=A0A1S3TGZ1_VIGRR|nr:uncharacterized protein LOC106755405 [Vigna radiata var. radiata]
MQRSTFCSPSMVVNFTLMLRILEWGSLVESESDVVVLLKSLLQKNLLHESVVWSLVLHAKVAFGDLDLVWALDGRVEEATVLVREMEGKRLRPYGETFGHIVVAVDSGVCEGFSTMLGVMLPETSFPQLKKELCLNL